MVVSAWKENGLPTTTEIPVVIRKTFKTNIQDHMLVTMETVRENIRAGADVTLIDSRAKALCWCRGTCRS